MAATVSIICAIFCAIALIYAFMAYMDTRRYNSKIRKERQSKPKPKQRYRY